jgi:hypothetical protein
MTYYIAKMEDGYLNVSKLEIEPESLKPFSVKGLSGDYSDFFMYGENIVSKNVEKLRSFARFRNRLCT